MKYAQIRHYDISNGLGIRTSVFFTGCTHNCYNCFNKEYQDFSYGKEFTQKEIDLIIKYIKEDEVSGLTLLGGEPLQQNVDEMCNFLSQVRKASDDVNKKIWIYSGYTYKEILEDPGRTKIISYCDILVDGRYVEILKNLRLKFRGSTNQRIIDIQQSLKMGKIIDISDYI